MLFLEKNKINIERERKLVMPIVQMNKRFGLQKLKKIAGKDRRWTVSPHMVLRTPEKFRIVRAKGMPRVLIRTDEVGKTYKHFVWDDVPRYENTPQTVQLQHRLLEETVRDHLIHKGIETGKNYDYSIRRLLYIMHPTRPREDIHLFGTLQITPHDSATSIELKLGESDPNSTLHRKQVGPTVLFIKRGNKWTTSIPVPTLFKNYPNLLQTVRTFVNRAIKTRQINPKRTTEMSFLTWVDAPEKPEFFDLVEQRNQPEKKETKK